MIPVQTGPLYLRHGLFICLCFIAACCLWASYWQQAALWDQQPLGSTGGSIDDPAILTGLGGRQHMFQGNLKLAKVLYVKALISDPVYVPAWLGIGEIYYDEGEDARARAVLDYVATLTKGVRWWAWDKVLFACELGGDEILAPTLGEIVDINPDHRAKALKLADSLWREPRELLLRLGIRNLVHIFHYYLDTRQVKKAMVTWPAMHKNGLDTGDEFFRYIDFLLNQKEISEAGRLWRARFYDSPLLFDGDFHTPPLQKAFGWRITDIKGVSSILRRRCDVDGVQGPCLEVRFDGTANVDFSHVRQIVPLEPGKKYMLEGEMRSDSITTDRRPYWEVYGFGCQGGRGVTQMVGLSQGWTPFHLEFDTPEGCQAMTVRLRREASYHFDNKIAGVLWCRNLRITSESMAH